MPNNLQVENYIRLAFIKLVSEKEYSEISVTDIVNTAGVSRTSFYRFYKQKDDLLRSIKDTLNKTLQKYVDEIIEAEDIKGMVIKNLTFKPEEKRILSLLLKAHQLNYAVFAEFNLPELTHTTYDFLALRGAVCSIIIAYIIKGMKDDINVLSEAIEKVVLLYR